MLNLRLLKVQPPRRASLARSTVIQDKRRTLHTRNSYFSANNKLMISLALGKGLQCLRCRRAL